MYSMSPPGVDYTTSTNEAGKNRQALGSRREMADRKDLDFTYSKGAKGVGVTLSSAQHAACRRNGLDVHLGDARKVDVDTFGPFAAVASLGAFEHFCSVEDYEAGRQDEVYRDLFANVASTL